MKTRLQSSTEDKTTPFGSKPQGRVAAFLKPFQKFQKDEEGSIIIFSLFMFAMMLMIGGLAVDVMRAEYQRTEIQYTADRCALSASGLSQQLPAEDVVADCFQKSGLGWLNPTVIVDQTQNSKKVTILLPDPTIKTLFLSVDWSKVFKVGGGSPVEYLKTPAVAAAIDGVQKVEVSLVLDVSGSMGNSSASGRTKIEDLQIAAKQFVDALLLDAPHEDTYSISIVPYSIQVNAGEDLLRNMNVSAEHDFAHCVDFRTSEFNTPSVDQGIEIRRVGYIATRPDREDKRQDPNIYSWLWNCPTSSDREILPLSGNIQILKDKIDDLTPQGWTSTEIGIKWGAALLDPSLKPVVYDMIADPLIPADERIDPMFAGRPYNYGEEGVLKVIVAMTDGANTRSYELLDPYRTGMSNVWLIDGDDPSLESDSPYIHHNRYHYWVYNPNHSGSKKYRYLKYTKSGSLKISRWEVAPPPEAKRLTMAELWKQASTYFVARRLQQRAGLSGSAWGDGSYKTYYGAEKDVRMAAICQAAKEKNILLYTIGFEVSNSNALKLQSCATTSAHFFRVDGVDIADAFAEIAAQLKSLRLVR
ncbi:MAG TPA: hypothetical protein ENK34_06720 [Rhodobacteraceae bacterium]|nr:hypothetical protein [Paracoccaceae bacterium]